MSGPKVSRYELREAEKRRLRMRILKEDRLNCIHEYIADLKRLVETDGVNRALRDRAEELLSLAGLADMSYSLEEVQTYSNKLRDCKSAIIKEIKLSEQKEESGRSDATLELELDMSGGFEIPTAFEKTHKEPVGELQETIGNEKLEIKSELEDMRENPDLPDELKRQISSAIHSINNVAGNDYLKNFKAVTIGKIRKSYREFVEAFEAERLERLIQEREQAYIAEAIDEVMAEMGYELLGSRERAKKSGRQSKNELYTFGGDTSLLVTYSDDGKISMEVGAVDSVDREPTEHERERLAYDMERFCDGFAEIEKRLSEKGVVLKNRLATFPLSHEYAQIINTSGFDMVRKSNLKKSVSKPKYLYREV